jgi:hypothetical protein
MTLYYKDQVGEAPCSEDTFHRMYQLCDDETFDCVAIHISDEAIKDFGISACKRKGIEKYTKQGVKPTIVVTEDMK